MKNIDLRIGLTEISHLSELSDVQVKLPEKEALPNLGEAISSHFDALWQVDLGEVLVEKQCSLSDKELRELANSNFYKIAADSLAWFEEYSAENSIEPDLLCKVKPILQELSSLELELSINRQLLV